jgi:FdhD protein
MPRETQQPSAIAERDITRIAEGRCDQGQDLLAVEEPCEIRIGDQAVAVTMRTPGHDAELAAGFLFTEGIVEAGDIGAISHCAADAALHPENVVEVRLAAARSPRRDLRRNFYATSSCGICGKASIDAIHVDAPPLRDGPRVGAERLSAMVQQLQQRQSVFSVTGGLHAAAIFDAGGETLVVREDVGRHNAVDKAIGHMLLAEKLPLTGAVLVVSGRTSFEIVQKALVARIAVVAGVSAASSLAVDFAARSNMTLVGFLRGDRMNVYSGADRIERAGG